MKRRQPQRRERFSPVSEHEWSDKLRAQELAKSVFGGADVLQELLQYGEDRPVHSLEAMEAIRNLGASKAMETGFFKAIHNHNQRILKNSEAKTKAPTGADTPTRA